MTDQYDELDFGPEGPRPVTAEHRAVAAKLADELWTLPFESIGIPPGYPEHFWGDVHRALQAIAKGASPEDEPHVEVSPALPCTCNFEPISGVMTRQDSIDCLQHGELGKLKR